MPTKIEWCTETWNPITGCSPISEGCEHCYAARMAQRLKGRCGYDKDEPFKVTSHAAKIAMPLRWNKPRMIFVCSMGDLFHDEVFTLESPFDDPNVDHALDSFLIRTDWPMLDAIMTVMERAKHHTFLILTKRPENMLKYFKAVQKSKQEYADAFQKCPTEAMRNSPAAKVARFEAENPVPSNIWLGVTAENQQRADERIPILLETPAKVRFVSVEPMLGPVDLNKKECICSTWRKGHTIGTYLDWVICGGETGPGSRPMHPDWVRSLRDQCQAAEVPFFFKSWGDWIEVCENSAPDPLDLPYFHQQKVHETGQRNRIFGDFSGVDSLNGWSYMVRVGKKRAGRELDGRTWDEYPGGDQ